MVSLWTKAGATIVIQLRTPGLERLSTCPSVLDQLHLRMPAPPHHLEKDGSWLFKAVDWQGEGPCPTSSQSSLGYFKT